MTSSPRDKMMHPMLGVKRRRMIARRTRVIAAVDDSDEGGGHGKRLLTAAARSVGIEVEHYGPRQMDATIVDVDLVVIFSTNVLSNAEMVVLLRALHGDNLTYWTAWNDHPYCQWRNAHVCGGERLRCEKCLSSCQNGRAGGNGFRRLELTRRLLHHAALVVFDDEEQKVKHERAVMPLGGAKVFTDEVQWRGELCRGLSL
tara:strand:- start:3739 stop:4341 length:603 start_codon:yes stop_codon:yes gene_type:complete